MRLGVLGPVVVTAAAHADAWTAGAAASLEEATARAVASGSTS